MYSYDRVLVKRIAILTVLLFFFGGAMAEVMRVCVPVADVRSKLEITPSGLTGSLFSGDIGCQETQLMYGEPVEIIEILGDWYKIIASDQEKCDRVWGTWSGYSGYVLASALALSDSFKPNAYVSSLSASIFADSNKDSPIIMKIPMGSRIQVCEQNESWFKVTLVDGKTGYVKKDSIYMSGYTLLSDIGDSLVKKTRLFLGMPYVWGGTCPLDSANNNVSSVDCSGLTYLVHLALGIKIPRDAHDQYLKSKKIKSGADLKLGDLIFFARTKESPRMNHVMMYSGNGKLIEASGFGFSKAKQIYDINFDISQVGTREISFDKYISKTINFLKSGDEFELECFNSKENKMVKEQRYIFFGTFISTN